MKSIIGTHLDLVLHEGSLGLVQQLLEVLVEELEDQGELLVGVEHIDQPHDVGVLQLFQQRNLPNGSTWNSLILRLKSDGLEGVDLSRVDVPGLVDDSVGSFTHLLELLVLVNLRLHIK